MEQSLRACMDEPVSGNFHMLILRRTIYDSGISELAEDDNLANHLVVGTQRPKAQRKNTINYHLMRLYPRISPPRKQGK